MSTTQFALLHARVVALATALGEPTDNLPTTEYGLELKLNALLNQLLANPPGSDGTDQTARAMAQQAQDEVDALEGLVATLAVEDTSPPPEDIETPPVAPDDPEPVVVDPIVISQDDYIPDLTAFSPYNKPRLSAIGTPDYFPAAVSQTPGNLQFFGIRLAPVGQSLAFQRIEIPLRAKNVVGAEKFGMHLLRKVGEAWVTVATRYLTLAKNSARIYWNKTLVVPAGEEWAVVFGLNQGNSNIFYGSPNPYPAPYGGHGIGLASTMPSTVGRVYDLVQGTGHRLIRLYGVELPKDVIGPLDPDDLPEGFTGLPSPQTLTHTTGSLTPGSSATFALSVPRSFTLQTIAVSRAARVLAYETDAARTADAGRAVAAVPTDAVYQDMSFESNLPYRGSLTDRVFADFSPNTEGVWYMRVVNTSATAGSVTLTLTLLPREL